MNLDEIYRETILDHNQSPRNYGHLDHPTKVVGLLNPTCGDQIQLELLLQDGKIQDIRFSGQGCSISMASASMMTEAIKGKTIEEALALTSNFKNFVTGGTSQIPLGDLEALHGVSQFPSRVKCATLAHNAFEKAMAEPSE
ncbi:Fe-S cluster assembly sulfur transfer protein SufU [Sulfobacillus thermosulfidooxidans]|uniref:Nitrogen fixation protein NifU n=2 Tax=Sulfobacillus thermosulfidooxidans TaxID=28034 RepID=A0A1W1WIQ0_SULTA|nr:SUF system NifU family Fe-S cluster assembly protein [Sulfobacillus thermosulfidooxidans]OLZ08567.1 SUF system NifU family Fe-S cluster assembly protein [Sulfobacillus thermosulfidooxidans]OLZ13169.1 SUF system NifU family Fe-S cluster assembly protein [Sulfobacillus thermosulfidooxidans]OLZ21549.1 SUF system NifU family Fe-S cluster assembly protein [Sulfobacillus thermosulfidooxidans]PSR29245.1 MAG: SUF system NifU family Fe-S cluster assembly protein [Sulfobacillus thermosulfidooxidans]S